LVVAQAGVLKGNGIEKGCPERAALDSNKQV
jgi:hypothetical protein